MRDSAVSQSRRRFRKVMEEDKSIGKRLENIRRKRLIVVTPLL
jgi:hypothetical protein